MAPESVSATRFIVVLSGLAASLAWRDRESARGRRRNGEVAGERLGDGPKMARVARTRMR